MTKPLGDPPLEVPIGVPFRAPATGSTLNANAVPSIHFDAGSDEGDEDYYKTGEDYLATAAAAITTTAPTVLARCSSYDCEFTGHE